MNLDDTIGRIVEAAVERAVAKAMRSTPPPRLTVSVSEAAQMLGVCRNTVAAMTADGRLPTVDLGTRNVLIPVEALTSIVTQSIHQRPKAPQ